MGGGKYVWLHFNKVILHSKPDWVCFIVSYDVYIALFVELYYCVTNL